MIHIVELVALLLFLCVGHGVIDVSPHPARRIITNWVLWLLVMSTIIAIFSVPVLVVWAVYLAVIMIGVFAFRWIWSELIIFLRGPHLIHELSRRTFRNTLRDHGGFARGESARIVRKVLRQHHPHIALLGLTRLDMTESSEVLAFIQNWRRASETALEEVRSIAMRIAKAGDTPADMSLMLLLAQALSLYENKSVDRAVAAACEAGRKGRGARHIIVAYLTKSGKPSETTRNFLGLHIAEAAKEHKSTPLPLGSMLWPARCITRSGFPLRSATFIITFILLIAYGIFALNIGRSSGWVYLAVALFIHIEAVFAVEDFLPATRGIRKGG